MKGVPPKPELAVYSEHWPIEALHFHLLKVMSQVQSPKMKYEHMSVWTRLGSWPHKASVNRGGLGKKGEEGSDSDQGWEGTFLTRGP